MHWSKPVIAALLMLLPAALTPQSIHARQSAHSPWLSTGQTLPAPTAYLSFCTRSPKDCQHQPDRIDPETFQSQIRQLVMARMGIGVTPDPLPADIVTDEADERLPLTVAASTQSSQLKSKYQKVSMTADLWQTAQDINLTTNRTIQSQSDLSQFGKNDYWFVPGLTGSAYGDCEDYVLQKRRLLVEKGFPSEVLTIAIAETRRGETHAVLILTTTDGDYVLDNLNNQIRVWHSVKYRWISRQSATDPLIWVSL